jgi:hypothetical protein
MVAALEKFTFAGVYDPTLHMPNVTFGHRHGGLTLRDTSNLEKDSRAAKYSKSLESRLGALRLPNDQGD